MGFNVCRTWLDLGYNPDGLSSADKNSFWKQHANKPLQDTGFRNCPTATLSVNIFKHIHYMEEITSIPLQKELGEMVSYLAFETN